MPDLPATFNERLTADFVAAIDNNRQACVYIPGAGLIGTPFEIDEHTLTLALGGGMRAGEITKTVIDLEAINAYTINAQ